MREEDNKNPETCWNEGEDGHSLEIEEYEHLTTLLQASQGVAGADGLPRSIVARLALLEENFARICTVVGKLEQEILKLKGQGG